MAYRTKTYIAADWDGDKNAVEQLYKWKKSNYWSLDFHDAHDSSENITWHYDTDYEFLNDDSIKQVITTGVRHMYVCKWQVFQKKKLFI